MDLWSHVTSCSKLCLEQARAVSTFNWSGKTQVGDLEHVVSVENQILRLKVAMGVSLLVHEAKAVNQLLEVVASLTLGKATSKSDKVEKFAASNELKNNKLDVFASLFGINLHTFVNLNEANDVAVLKVGECGDLGVDQFLEGLIWVDDFDGIAGTGCVLGELDLAGDAASERPTQGVLV